MNEIPDERTMRRARKQVIVRRKKTSKNENEIARKSKKKITPERRAELDRKADEALELRMAGTSWADIAKHLGYKHPSSAKNVVERRLMRTEISAAKETVALDLARLDEFQMRCMYALRNNGDLGQIDRMMRIMEMRYKLLGVTDETVRALQSEHGITNVSHTKNQVMVVQAAPESEEDFIKKMMNAVGVNPDSKEAKTLLRHRTGEKLALPMAPGSANQMADDARNRASMQIEEDDVVDAELVDE